MPIDATQPYDSQNIFAKILRGDIPNKGGLTTMLKTAHLAEAFGDAIYHAERPIVNGHVVAKFLLSRAVRDAGVKVVLTGEGSDETLGVREMVFKADVVNDRASASLALVGDRIGRIRGEGFTVLIVEQNAALALGIMHILVRDGLANRDYIARHTLGFDRVEAGQVLAQHPLSRLRHGRREAPVVAGAEDADGLGADGGGQVCDAAVVADENRWLAGEFDHFIERAAGEVEETVFRCGKIRRSAANRRHFSGKHRGSDQ